MTRAAKLTVLCAAALVILSLVVATTRPGGLELRATPVNGGDPLLVLPYHSVEQAPIWEEHSLDREGRIYIEEERYLKFGAGMGRMPGVGRMVKKGPYEAIVDMHMPTGDFVLRIGSPGVDHTIIWRGTRTNLSALAPHQAVRFSARPVSCLYTWWSRFFPHPATPNSGSH